MTDEEQWQRDHERMCRAIDAQPPEYFIPFGITKESWQRWRELERLRDE